MVGPCPHHKRYRARRAPFVRCESCWRFYFATKDAEEARKRAEHLKFLQIEGNCAHPNVVEFRWEHDNGYGRQTTLTGYRCLDCQRKNYWSRDSKYGWEIA